MSMTTPPTLDNILEKDALNERAKDIRLLVLDVDGVLTDGRLYFSNSGEEMKSFHTLDGQGIKSLRSTGVEVGIITGRSSELVARRAGDLGIHLLIQGREDKFIALNEMLEHFACPLSNIAFMGDDYPDLTVMTKVGLSISVPNGHPELLARAHFITKRHGGTGAVREVCDLIMQAQGTYQSLLEGYIA